MTRTATPATTLTTAADALRSEEVDRTRAFLRMGGVVAAFVVGAVMLVPGDRRLAAALIGGTLIALAASMWIHRQLRNPLNYDPRKMTALALLCIVCGQLGVLYVGYVSAAPMVILLGVYFFCRTESRRAAISIYAIAAGAYAVEAMLVISGVIEDPGFYPIRKDASPWAQFAGHLVAQQAYAMSFWLARLTRKASLESIEGLQRATRLAAQREAQVEELRQDLDRALKIGGPGRFTGHVVGTWTLGNVLGRGAMGEVYEATRPDGTEGAVKLLRRELLSDPKHVERFLREVRAASSLESPNVVKVLEASTPEDPIPFLAMERLRGQTLGEILRDGGTLPRSMVAELVAQIGGVLEQARIAGVVHRDLKPHNLFLTEAGDWKILDFGVAMLGESGGTLTQGGVIGTPAYMAPEQARGAMVDPRADLYAMGAVIYRCLTGRVPFVAKDTPAVLYAVVHAMPQRPGTLATVPSDIEQFLALALAKARDARFQTGAELAAAYADANRDALSDALRARARDLVRRNPWREPDDKPTQQLPAAAAAAAR